MRVYRGGAGQGNTVHFPGGLPSAGLLCFVRIGVSLTYGILCPVGAAVGVATPMLFRPRDFCTTPI